MPDRGDTRLVIPYTRQFRKGSRGKDCKAVKRALRHAGDLKRKGDLDDNFGVMAVAALRRFQKRNDIHKGVGTYTNPTHTALRVHRHFDRYGAWLMQQAKKEAMATSAGGKAAKAVASAMYAHAHQPRHYTQTARRAEGYYNKTKPPDMWGYADCSAFVLWCYWLAGLAEADVGPFDGWTGSMVEHGRVVSFADAKPGDSAFYRNHVAMLVSKRDGGMVISHGHEGGPFLERINYRGDLLEIRNFID